MGYNYSDEDLNLLKTGITDLDNQVKELSTEVLLNARQFSDLMTECRATIVRSIKSEYKQAIETLPLPMQTKKYLLYEDLPKQAKWMFCVREVHPRSDLVSALAYCFATPDRTGNIRVFSFFGGEFMKLIE